MLSPDAPSGAYPLTGRLCMGCAVASLPPDAHPNRRYCSDRCKWRHHTNTRYHRLNPTARFGIRGRHRKPALRCRCRQCNVVIQQRNTSGLCQSCYNDGRRTRRIGYMTPGLGSIVGYAQRRVIPTAIPKRAVPPLRRYTCCGWMLRVLHDEGSDRHRLAVNAYMRKRQRRTLDAYYRYHLGPKSSREELPSALVELAVTRRRLQEAAKLVGHWRVTDGQVDDPS